MTYQSYSQTYYKVTTRNIYQTTSIDVPCMLLVFIILPKIFSKILTKLFPNEIISKLFRKHYKHTTKILPKYYQTIIKLLPKYTQTSYKMTPTPFPKHYQNTTKDLATYYQITPRLFPKHYTHTTNNTPKLFPNDSKFIPKLLQT